MNKESINDWLSLAANLGVLVGIIFLAFELQQNNRNLEAEIDIYRHQIRIEDYNRTALDPGLAEANSKLIHGENLTDIEKERMFNLWGVTFLNWQYYFSQGTPVGQDAIDTFRRVPGALEIYNEFSNYYLSDRFKTYMQESVFSQLE